VIYFCFLGDELALTLWVLHSVRAKLGIGGAGCLLKKTNSSGTWVPSGYSSSLGFCVCVPHLVVGSYFSRRVSVGGWGPGPRHGDS
jgi:hypothetical protein